MKTYRAGVLDFVIGGHLYCIQKKTWYGWRTLCTYHDKNNMNSAINDLKQKVHIVL